LARQGKLEEGRALIRAVPESEADDAKAKISAEVQLLRDNKQFQLVYNVLQDAVRRNPGDVDLSYDLAMAAEKIDKIGEMEILLRKLIADKPDYHNAYNALGYSLADRKLRLPEAKALIQKALEFAPDDPFIQDSLGWVEYRSGNLALAAQILQTAYQRRQDAEIAAHLGEVLWGMGQTTEARAVWNSGLKQNPENETLLATIKRLSPP
jgi:Flp pilus assembly protein TadD